MFLFQRKYRALLGLDITTSSVKLIELAMGGGQYRVEAYAAEPTPQNAINEKAIVDAEAVGEAIRRAVKRAGAKASEVAVAISGDAAITKVIQMPRALRSADLEAQVEMQADQYIPFPMDDMPQQVSRSLQFYLASGSGREQPEKILVCGGCANIPGVAEVISSRVGISAEKGDPLGQMKLSSRAKAQAVQRDATALLTACGLALRSFD